MTIETNQPRIKGGGLGGQSARGSYYLGATLDGPASWFVFRNSSSYDAQRAFDSRFGSNYDQAFPSGGVAVIRFASITIAGAPSLQLNGPLDIALIGDAGINDTAAVYSMNLSQAGSFTLATNNGPISLTSGTFSATGTTFKFLQLYQRGAGGVSFNGTISLPSASFYIDSGSNLALAAGSNVTANRAVFNAVGALTLRGTLSTNVLQLTSENSIQIQNGVVSPNQLYAFAPTLSTTKSLAVAGGGRLQIGAGGIDATGFNLTGFDDIITTGNLSASNLGATNQLSVGGAILGTSGTYSINAFSIAAGNGINYSGRSNAAGATLTLRAASLLFDSTPGGVNGVNVDGGDGSLLGLVGGDGGTLNLGTTAAPIAGDVTINKTISATTGANPIFLLSGGNGGTVNVTSNGTVAVNSTIKVSESSGSAKSTRGGNINLTSKRTTGSAINVSSSAQLLTLLSNAAPGPGGSIKIISAGGDINMSGTATADRGTVEITNNGGSGIVTLSNANLHGDIVKAGALGNNGTLNVGGGTINADSQIKLYAGGSNGQVNFTENVTLSGNSVKTIAADAVTIFNGKTVTISGPGPASVFTNQPNYSGSGGNGSTTGTFSGQGATTQPLSAAPGY